MKRLILLLLLVLGVCNLNAFEPLDFNLKFYGSTGETFDSLRIGTKINATDSIDILLDEQELPPLCPFGGLSGALKCKCLMYPDTVRTDHWTYRDYRPVTGIPGDSLVYVFEVCNPTISVDIKWPAFDRSLIDSAFFSDIFQFRFKTDMIEKTDTTFDYSIYSPAKFKMVLFPKYTPVYVSEEKNQDIDVVQTDNVLIINSKEPIKNYVLIGVLGNVVSEENSEFTSKQTDISDVPKGTYLLVIKKIDGRIITKKIIK